ncbi:SulP family inorganic anion transporter [Spirulina major]|uniref:SulP family inorganic anion transporter n=1 Tax=Spirulina major TaxID=270636 RepID=UPI000933A609|nr:SulP family inorganic anion transporter [Spirulina major]
MNLKTLKRDWFSNVRADLLAGAVVGLALIPEAIAFSIIAGVDPKVGLYASFIIAVMTAIFGGRPGSISAATGAMALLMIDLVKLHGLQYLFATTLLTGMIQVLFGVLKLGRQMRYVPRAVMIGYINALAVLIFLAQLPQLIGKDPIVYLLTALSLGIIYILPRFTQVIPSPLVTLAVMTIGTIALKIDVPTVGDMGALPTTLPTFALPQVPLTWTTLTIILPYALTLALVGLLASFLTAALVDELTDTPSDKNQEAKGQGLANIVTAFFGGMAGCGMIGQSVINVQSGGRTRLSTLAAGVLLLFAILGLQDWVRQMPMAALVAIMFMVAIGTFRWSSFWQIRRVPVSETIVMVATMLVTVFTRNFALGVATGIVLSTVFFTSKIAQLVTVHCQVEDQGSHQIYRVSGQLFFLSKEEFFHAFDFTVFVDRVTLDLSQAHLWDQGAVEMVDRVMTKFRRLGAEVELVGLNAASETLVAKIGLPSQRQAVQQATSE